MTAPMVSVGMITYNHAPYIAQAIEGVLQQKTSFTFELIIGEDCSIDGTREIVLRYQEKHPSIIRVITSDMNVGRNRNGYRTYKACQGKYLAICEGDDYWHNPYKLQKQVNYLESHKECGLLFSDSDVYYCKSRRYRRSYNYNNGFKSAINLDIQSIIGGEKIVKWTCTAMIRRNIYEQIVESDPYLHQNDNFLLNDNQLWAEASLISMVTYIPESLATYRVLEESASRSKNLRKQWRFSQSASEMKTYLCDKHKLPENIRIREESAWYESSLRLAFLDRNAELADEVRRGKGVFTWKEWFRYYGAKNVVFNYLYRAASYILRIFRKKQQEKI